MAGERLNAEQAAKHVGLSIRTVRNLQQQDRIPHVKVSARKVFYEVGSHTTILLGVEDITRRRALEHENEELLRQKGVLLDEVQHRVHLIGGTQFGRRIGTDEHLIGKVVGSAVTQVQCQLSRRHGRACRNHVPFVEVDVERARALRTCIEVGHCLKLGREHRVIRRFQHERAIGPAGRLRSRA